LFISVLFVELTSYSDLFLTVSFLQLEVNLSEHVFFLETQALLGLAELARVEDTLRGKRLKFFLLRFEVPFDVGLFDEPGIHILLDEKLQRSLFLNELLH